MRISEIVQKLEEIRVAHGDLECLDSHGYGIWNVIYYPEFRDENYHEDEHVGIEND